MAELLFVFTAMLVVLLATGGLAIVGLCLLASVWLFGRCGVS